MDNYEECDCLDTTNHNDDCELRGTCDTCGGQYNVASRYGRCGDCGECPEHCPHVPNNTAPTNESGSPF